MMATVDLTRLVYAICLGTFGFYALCVVVELLDRAVVAIRDKMRGLRLCASTRLTIS